MKRLLCVLLLLVSGLFVASAESLSLDAAVKRALGVNSTFLSAQLAVDQAQDSLSPVVNWKGIAVSATQKQSSSGSTASPASQTTLGLSLPLFDQLGASATVDQDKTTQVSLTATPLAHADTSAQARIAYDKAVLAAAQARVTLETSVSKAYLAQVSAQAQAAVQARQAAMLETAYQDSKARYDKGKVTLAEVRTALQDWTAARSTQTTLERSLIKAKAELAALLQTESVETSFDLASLQAAVRALGGVDATVTGNSSAVKVQALEVESQQAKADALWLLDPNLSVSGSASVPAGGSVTWSGAVTLTLALGDWQVADKALAQRSADLARQTLEAQKTAARSTEAQAVLSVQAASDSVEVRELALTQAQQLQTETNLLLKSGSATELDREDADIGVATAENDLFAAWADLYGARLDLAVARS